MEGEGEWPIAEINGEEEANFWGLIGCSCSHVREPLSGFRQLSTMDFELHS
jgi:hypothetical protein